LCGELNCLLPQRYQRLCVAAVCALPAPRHKFKQSAPQTTTNVTSPEDAYHASRRRSDRIRLPPGCRSDRSQLSVRLFPSRLRCAVGIESRAVCSRGNKYFSAPDRTNLATEFAVRRVARDRRRAKGAGRIDRADFSRLVPSARLPLQIAFHCFKDTPFASFAIESPFASGKPQNFNAVFTIRKDPRLAGWPVGGILTIAG
jgi:hypothetical protein